MLAGRTMVEQVSATARAIPNSGIGMTNFGHAQISTINLNVVLDKTVRNHVEVKVGLNDWARATMFLSAAVGQRPLLEKIARMLAAVTDVHAATFVVHVGGPDAGDTEGTQRATAAEWVAVLDAMRADAPAPRPIEAVGMPPNTRTSPEARILPGRIPIPTGGNEWSKVVSESKSKESAKLEPEAKRKPDPELAEIQSLANIVARHAREFGANPDFGATKPESVRKAHNYIRSVSSRPSAPDAVVEAARLLLARA